MGGGLLREVTSEGSDTGSGGRRLSSQTLGVGTDELPVTEVAFQGDFCDMSCNERAERQKNDRKPKII